MGTIDLEKIQFDEKGLVPAIIQDVKTKEVLMLAYMNRPSLEKTLEEKTTWFYSRKRKALWHKGETSGNTQRVIEASYDCDGDTLLFQVEQTGVACHLGTKTCFNQSPARGSLGAYLEGLYRLLADRKENPKEKSYTSYLFNTGLDKILKKVGEESAEVIIASKDEEGNEVKPDTRYEVADLFYHVLVLLVALDIPLEEVEQELLNRS
ncbi:bifunctional phosphoribosyl-AMP cyclohydrolase/phosphoribosyl-ATP diphosphatase HisIE [Isachenkonia alkalipeptolytica]|uniref:Histidine biosynthesis bifunctional protein HisIE n=1 Tax=Isachenkonia alkalipeptolytica TaxID=2565777 RepID=A0AA43XJ36_9CLOT|nr:bifunctional phosphoribosyl-AMP cyclohydrolase/phosphoribosyl-ATP diphosphatase HisIE [Isachenkonia alkalipeptolytica]NBG87517.1 bifunctional phosphoribosyl-AMP cyclohydrolase/phosphoribosyl-ATP diphosphatase HisIE [Isachenkonia alkalipeptolytica]